MNIPEGKVTAIVGESGSGKTTLLKMLLKFYEPLNGDIRVGAFPFARLNHESWRERCGAVLQDGFIFCDTIAKNIAMSDQEPDYERLVSSSITACIYGFIESLPEGFNTKIGPEGMGLSGGQRQRLLIARAIYKNPDYLFFDEATSSLDANNEKTIINNLNEFYKGKTVVVIAHRLSTVKNADQIIVLEKGRIKEQGSHHELVKRKGGYYSLVKNQLELGN
jgi:ATP-binding cassette subfamily B protein